MIVERGQAHADDLLRGDAVSALFLRDRHLATTLVLGVLRWQILLDQRLRSLLARPNARLDPEVLITLRLGAFQLLHLDRIPARAAIDESVELARQAGHRFASGMVNAVLRKLGGTPQPFSAPESVIEAHPAWMVERWSRFFGPDAAHAICAHNQDPPATTIRLATSEAEAELTQAGITLEPGTLLNAAKRVTGGDVIATAAWREGRVRIQDEGSQLVAEIAGHRNTILDCCAAPGGKTLILAERNPDAHIVACEASAARLESLRERLAPCGERIECTACRCNCSRASNLNSMWFSPTCPAAALERWAATRRFATGSARKICPGKPIASVRSSPAQCAQFVPAGTWFTPPALWSRKRTRR